MKCVLVGGAGFIGSHLVGSLLQLDHDVVVFDRPDARCWGQASRTGATQVVGDFLNPDDIRPALSGCDVLFHLVSTTVPQTSNDDPLYDVETNVVGTLRLLEQARQAEVKKVVLVSSGGTVYGIPQEIPIKEGHPTEPISSYGIGKLMIEKYLHLYHTLYSLDYCILRTANAYGERGPIAGPQGVIGAFLNKALHEEKLTIWGDGSVVRDYVYVGDVAAALAKAAAHEGEPRIFNIGAGKGHSIDDIIRIIEDILRRPVPAEYLTGRPFDVPVNVLDISRARKYLNWQPVVGLFEGISRTYEEMLNQHSDGRAHAPPKKRA